MREGAGRSRAVEKAWEGMEDTVSPARSLQYVIRNRAPSARRRRAKAREQTDELSRTEIVRQGQRD